MILGMRSSMETGGKRGGGQNRFRAFSVAGQSAMRCRIVWSLLPQWQGWEPRVMRTASGLNRLRYWPAGEWARMSCCVCAIARRRLPGYHQMGGWLVGGSGARRSAWDSAEAARASARRASHVREHRLVADSQSQQMEGILVRADPG